jgi:hypothetical protein
MNVSLTREDQLTYSLLALSSVAQEGFLFKNMYVIWNLEQRAFR